VLGQDVLAAVASSKEINSYGSTESTAVTCAKPLETDAQRKRGTFIGQLMSDN